jgi:peptide/nickel transport system permease protein
MQRYIFRRILLGMLTLVGLSMVVFSLARVGGDPVALLVGFDAPPEVREAKRQELGLDRSLPVQYWLYMKDVVTGDFGDSLYYNQPAVDVVMDRFPNTLKLVAVAAGFGIPIGLLLGILCAIKRNKVFDILGRTMAVIGQSLPSFWIGIMLILFFSMRWEIFPAAGMGGPSHYVLPPIAMAAFLVAGVTRLTRSSMLEVLGSDYITFARARGAPESLVILKHALRNASIPVLTFTAPMVAAMIANAVVTETVFAWPGVGRLAYEATLGKDFAVIQLIVLLLGTMLIFVNLLTDILYSWFDPRIRYR